MSTTRPGRKGKSPRSPRAPESAAEVPIDDDSGISSILAGYEPQTRSPQRVQQPVIRAATIEGYRDTGGLFDLDDGMQGGTSSTTPITPATTTSFQVVDKAQEEEEKDGASGSKSSSKESSSSESGSDKEPDADERDEEDAESSSPADPADPSMRAMSMLARRMITLAERLDKSAKKKKKGHSQDANDKLRLSKIPLNNNGKDLPSAKSWNNWRTVKLHNWAAMQKSGEKVVKKCINSDLSESNK